MSKVLADNHLLVKDLSQFSEPVQILSPGGKLLGLFVPATPNGHHRPRASTLSSEEIERRARSGNPGRTTREVFEHLLTLAKDEPSREHLRRLIAEVEERDQCDGP